MSITNEQIVRLRKLHNEILYAGPDKATVSVTFFNVVRNALPSLLTELERLRAAVEAAGGLCECGHVKAGHLWYCGYAVECPVDDCKCEAFTPDTQPGEGEGER